MAQTAARLTDTARQAAEFLAPSTGNAAYWLFSLGLIRAGMLGVPVLAGSSAYAIAECPIADHQRRSLTARTVSTPF